MKYIDRVLGRNEQIIHETGLHWITFVDPSITLLTACVAGVMTSWLNVADTPIAATIAVVAGGLGLVYLFRAVIDWATTEIAVTTHRVVYKRGLIARDTIEINFDRVEGLDIKQSVLGRILNYGTVIIRGTGIGVQPMTRVAAPLALRIAALGD